MWLAVYRKRNEESVSPKLRTLPEAVYRQIFTEPLDLIKRSLERLLFFLSVEAALTQIVELLIHSSLLMRIGKRLGLIGICQRSSTIFWR